MKRRKFLGLATAGTSVLGGIFVSIPFIKSWNIRKGRIRDFDTKVDISMLATGSQIRATWMGKPILIYRRTDDEVNNLAKTTPHLEDPESEQSVQPEGANNSARSIRPDIFVVIPLCTHLGCEAPIRGKDDYNSIGGDWDGGFFCPCHGSKFDLAGRVYKNMPAQSNMQIPPYEFKDENTILIGGENSLKFTRNYDIGTF